MKIGISALVFNIEESIHMCRSIDSIKHIEVGIDNIEECEIIKKYKDILQELGVSISIHLPLELNTCENINFIRKSWIEFIVKIDEELKELDIKYFNLHLGFGIGGRVEKNREKFLEISRQFLDDICCRISRPISIENMYSNGGDFVNIGNIVYDFEYIFSKVKTNNLWFCYDTGHNLINPDEYIKTLEDRTKVVHLSDNDGIKDIHIGIGRGILSRECINELIELDVDYMILEINQDYIYESIETLKAIIKEA